MLNALEQKLLQSLAENYPDWWASKHIVNIGKRLVQHRADYRFDKRLILTKHPTIIDRIRAGYAYARYMTLQGNNYLVDATADALYINCYFLQKDDSIAFASAIHFPRYFFELVKRGWKEAYSLIRHQTDSGTSTYVLMAITLEVFYHEQLGEWIQKEDVVLSDEELSQV
jgi:hypothetical protein